MAALEINYLFSGAIFRSDLTYMTFYKFNPVRKVESFLRVFTFYLFIIFIFIYYYYYYYLLLFFWGGGGAFIFVIFCRLDFKRN